MGRGFGAAPGHADFQILARAAFARIPAPFARHLEDIVIVIEEFPDEETVEALDVSDPWMITGVYQGRSLRDASAWDTAEMAPRIVLYRQPLLAEWCETGVTLEALVSHVVVHEVGHHFGLSDAQMYALEYQVV